MQTGIPSGQGSPASLRSVMIGLLKSRAAGSLSRELWALGKRVKGAEVQDQSSSASPVQEIASWGWSLSWGEGSEESQVRERGCE